MNRQVLTVEAEVQVSLQIDSCSRLSQSRPTKIGLKLFIEFFKCDYFRQFCCISLLQQWLFDLVYNNSVTYKDTE